MVTSAEHAFISYLDSFVGWDVDSVLPHYGIPTCFITPAFTIWIPDAEQLRAVLSAQLDQMQNEGIQRTNASDIRTQELSSSMAVVTATLARINASGDEAAEVHAAYTMRHDDDRWRVVAVAVGST